ncbi:MAG: DUF4040 domain-containing protein [Cyanobacteria bacterium J055]|nr:MAG: DUF4040 domain-containing protein [Cyanobacteria bacterium J055]
MNELDLYVYSIVALLPLAACLVIFQVNPYHALAMRGLLGAIAALVYTILGAPDVALTEALVGTLLAITLYAVAVRSSLVLRLGILEDAENPLSEERPFQALLTELRKILDRRQMRLEILSYSDKQALERALTEKEIHVTCERQSSLNPADCDPNLAAKPYCTTIRIQRIYEILQSELSSPVTALTYTNVPEVSGQILEEKHL